MKPDIYMTKGWEVAAGGLRSSVVFIYPVPVDHPGSTGVVTLHLWIGSLGWSSSAITEVSGCGSFRPGLGYSRVRLWSQRSRRGPQETSLEEWPHRGSSCRQAGLKSAGKSQNMMYLTKWGKPLTPLHGVPPVHGRCGVCTSCECPAPSWCGEAPLRRRRSGECCSEWRESPRRPESLRSPKDLLRHWLKSQWWVFSCSAHRVGSCWGSWVCVCGSVFPLSS